MLRYIIPSLQPTAQVERTCPYCQHPAAVIHQPRPSAITDTRLGSVRKLRMRCPHCQRTFTLLPAGLSPHAQRSPRVRALNLLLYALGLSYQATAQVMTALGALESDTSVYRDVVAAFAPVKRLHQRGQRKGRLAGIDGTYPRLAEPHNAHRESVVMVVDFSDARLLEVTLLDEQDESAMAALVKDLQATYGIADWLSDELLSYEKVIAQEPHYLCTTHFKKNKLRRVRELQKQTKSKRLQRDLLELQTWLRDAPADGHERLRQLYQRQRRIKRPKQGQRASSAARFKQLAHEVYEKWERVWQYTNNATERVIGLSLKIRAKLMQGFKVKEHIVGFAQMRGWMMRQGERIELCRLL